MAWHSGRSEEPSRRALMTGACAIGLAPVLGLSGGAALAQAPRARAGRYLLRGGVVLSLDPAIGDFDRARRVLAVPSPTEMKLREHGIPESVGTSVQRISRTSRRFALISILP